MSKKVKCYWPDEIEAFVKGGNYDSAWYALLATYRFACVAACVLDYGAYRKAVFVPFGGPGLWNRATMLLIKEIEGVNERNFGRDVASESKLAQEWTLSGLSREAILAGERTEPIRYPAGPPDWGAIVGDGEDTPFI
jgi:hypothetical protein